MQCLRVSIVYLEGEPGGPFQVSAAFVASQNSVTLLSLFLFTRGAELRQVPIVVSLASCLFRCRSESCVAHAEASPS
ncbi:hypothetical protein CGRA01v4_01128 [Colletotrichum graminicola]|nr:hypothetical protein CGRA01v4_01128 [Colletotrichum graminicola]